MSDFNEFIHYRALAYKYETVRGHCISDKLDHLIEKFPEGSPEIDGFKVPAVKNVCAKVSVQLSDSLDEVVAKLGISKRQFIEMALIQSVDHARHVIDCIDAEVSE